MDELAQHPATATLAINKAELIRAFQQKMPSYDPVVVAQAIYDLLEQKPTTLDGQALRLTINDQPANLASYNVVSGNLNQTTITVVMPNPITSANATKPKRGRTRRITAIVIEVADQAACFACAQSYLDTILKLNPAYGRAYLAKANIFYTQGNLFHFRQ